MLSLSCSEPTHGGSGLDDTGTSSFSSLDDSLTSLQWLQEFSILSAQVPQHAHQQLDCDGPASPLAGDPASMGSPLTPGKPTAAAFSRMHTLPGIVARGHCPDEVDYKTNAHVKPPYSYATLICMAMQASKKSKITLSSIYKWITDNFCYYRHADPTWQNSVRHNLSLNKCFIKVPREKSEPGKGGFWKIDPQYAERLLSGAYKKRRMPPVQINPAMQNRLRVNLPLPARSNVGLSMSTESQRLLREFEQMTEEELDWDPRLSDGTMLGSWPVVRGGGGHKRKQLLGSRNGGKVSRRSSSPLLCVDEQKEAGPLKGHFDWDALLDSALSGGLSLVEGDPLNPIIKEEDLTVMDSYMSASGASSRMADQSSGVSDLDQETFLATEFLETSWPEEEEEERGHGDFLCSSSVTLEQLFDLGGSLNVEASGRIETLL